MTKRLYTYVPEENTVDTEGLLSTAMTAQGYEKYRERTGKQNKEDVLAVLDSWDPEFRRSFGISFFNTPIPDDANERFVQFRDAKRLYSIDPAKLLAAGIIVRIRSINPGAHGTHQVKRISYKEIDWKGKALGEFLFSNVPHYIAETADGHIPAEYVTEHKKTAALGIPDREDQGDLAGLPEDTVATLVRQKHNADRARLHEDLRLGTPAGLYSWAVPKFLPDNDADKRLAIRQPLHAWSYKDFEGRLGHGYGKGTVEKMEESPIVVLKNTGDHIMFTRGDRRDAPIYNLRRTKNDSWLLFIRRKDQPPEIRAYPKEHFKSVPMDKVPELIANGAVVTKKIDGAGTLLYLGPHGVEAYGIRTGAKGEKPEYTDIIGRLRSIRVPKDLQGTVIRGEVFGERAGHSIGANELSGLLNANLLNAVNKRTADGIKLLVAGLAVHNNGIDTYDQKHVNSILQRLGSDRLVGMRTYAGKDALKAIEDMRNGADRLTHEGVVLHQDGKRPLKAKFKDDADVIIRNIFRADTDSDDRAGGFEYSLPDSEEIIGRVGTGFDHSMLRDMLAHPERYIGRTARIQSQEQYPSGAYRAPSFIAMKED